MCKIIWSNAVHKNMKIKVSASLIVIIVVPAVISLAQEIATKKDGRQVILNSNGTWLYVAHTPTTIAESAIETLRAYLTVSSWRDRTSLVLNPNKVKLLMEAHYSRKKWKTPDFKFLTTSEPIPSQTGWVKVEVEVKGLPSVYYLKKTDRGYRIDWETYVGFNSMSPEEFKATKPTIPVLFRVKANLADFYNFEFRNAENVAYSIAIEDGEGKRIGHGYANKNDITGQKLFAKLKDGRKHDVVVEIQCLPNARDGSCFIITKIINLDGWWFEENDQPAKKPTAPSGDQQKASDKVHNNENNVAEARVWTDNTGDFKVKARFIKLVGDDVILEGEQNQITLPLSSLSVDDQDFVNNKLRKKKP